MTDLLTAYALPWLGAFVIALASVCFPLLVAALRKRNINTTIIEAVGRAAGGAYLSIVQSGLSVRDPQVITKAIAVGGAYLAERIPETLAQAAVTPAGAAQMVGAELGKLLAADPTVSVVEPAPAA